jgi:hypothetical protein
MQQVIRRQVFSLYFPLLEIRSIGVRSCDAINTGEALGGCSSHSLSATVPLTQRIKAPRVLREKFSALRKSMANHLSDINHQPLPRNPHELRLIGERLSSELKADR